MTRHKAHQLNSRHLMQKETDEIGHDGTLGKDAMQQAQGYSTGTRKQAMSTLHGKSDSEGDAGQGKDSWAVWGRGVAMTGQGEGSDSSKATFLCKRLLFSLLLPNNRRSFTEGKWL